MIKDLIWLIKHKKEIENIIENYGNTENVEKSDKNEDKKYSIAGVPDFQKQYVNDLLNGKIKDNN